jgi:hypothetical protein
MEYISPKRRRTVGPGPLTPSSQGSPGFLQPHSEPQGIERRNTVIRKTRKESWSPSCKNPRKRQREEEELEFRQERETVGPDDSISQVVASIERETFDLGEYDEQLFANAFDHNPRNGDEGAMGAGQNEDMETDLSDNSAEMDADNRSEARADPDFEGFGEKAGARIAPGHYERAEYEDFDEGQEQLIDSVEDDDDEVSDLVGAGDLDSDDDDLEEDPELVAEAQANEFLARQHLLARRQDAISRFKVEGGWHPDAMNVFERLEMRSYEAILPWSWRIDFPTLPEVLFLREDTFIKDNYKSAASGE